MRLIPSSLFFLILTVSPLLAQSISENLPQSATSDAGTVTTTPAPPALSVASPVPGTTIPDPYTVTDVNADATADNATHARDQALAQAERAAYEQLCARMGASENTAKMSDDAIAAMVKSFDLQSERLSAKRYIGVFTIRFKPSALQKKLGKYMPGASEAGAPVDDIKPQPTGPVAHIVVAVPVDSLAAWADIKRRLGKVQQIARADTIDLGRGLGHMDLSFAGSLDDLENAVTAQGFVLRQNQLGDWELTDNSMVPR